MMTSRSKPSRKSIRTTLGTFRCRPSRSTLDQPPWDDVLRVRDRLRAQLPSLRVAILHETNLDRLAELRAELESFEWAIAAISATSSWEELAALHEVDRRRSGRISADG